MAGQRLFFFGGWRDARQRVIGEYSAASAHPKVVVLVAAAGAGKSRLLQRLATLLGPGRPIWWHTPPFPPAPHGGVLLVDDVARLDEAALATLLADPPGFVVMAARPEALARIAALGGAPVLVALAPMTNAEVQTAAQALCADAGKALADLPTALREELAVSSAGTIGALVMLIDAALAQLSPTKSSPAKSVIAAPPEPAKLLAVPIEPPEMPNAMSPGEPLGHPQPAQRAARHVSWGVLVTIPALLMLLGGGAAWLIDPGVVPWRRSPAAPLARQTPPLLTAAPRVAPQAAWAPLRARPAAVAQRPRPTLPDTAPPRVKLLFRRGDATAQRSAQGLARTLQAQRIAVDPPLEQGEPPPPGIRYFFAEDAAAAASVAHALGEVAPLVLAEAASGQAPGTIEITVAAPPAPDTGLVNR